MRRVTLQDVADRAGVSTMTVSNVVRGYVHVRSEMRARVQAAIEELGYRPNLSGRSLASGRSSMLGLAVPDLRRPYFAELAHAFARAAERQAYRLLLIETGGLADSERAVLQEREAGAIDGLVMHPQAMRAGELDAIRGSTPVVFLGEDPQPPSTDQVAIDNVAAARDATQHLLDAGRVRIGFLGNEVGRPSRTSELRVAGYRAALASAGIEADPALLVPRVDGDARGAEEALTRALERDVRIDALLCRDDLAAFGALRALAAHGLEVPRDVAVVGWDAIELGASARPSLTSVAAHQSELAEQALALLLGRLAGDESPGRHLIVPHRLVVRESAPALS